MRNTNPCKGDSSNRFSGQILIGTRYSYQCIHKTPVNPCLSLLSPN